MTGYRKYLPIPEEVSKCKIGGGVTYPFQVKKRTLKHGRDGARNEAGQAVSLASRSMTSKTPWVSSQSRMVTSM
jgi:hypothetical protein